MTLTSTLPEILTKKLTRLPEAAGLVFLVDTRYLVNLPPQLADGHNRKWNVLVFDGDDFSLRMKYEKLRKENERLLVQAVPRPNPDPSSAPIVLSYIGDLLNASNDIIDFSPQCVLSEIYTDPLPPALYDEPLLGLWSQDLDSFLKNLKYYITMSGKNQVLDRFDAIAISLSTAYPDCCSIDRFINLPYDPIERVRKYVRLMLAINPEYNLHALVSEVFTGSEQDPVVAKWTAIGPASLRRLMFVYLAAQRYLVPTPLVIVRGQGLLDLDTKGLEKEIDVVMMGMNRDPVLLRAIATLAEDMFTTEEMSRLAKEFRFGSNGDVIQSLGAETSAILSFCVARNFLAEHIANESVSKTFIRLDVGPIHNRKSELSDTKFKEQARRTLSILTNITWLEKSIASAPTPSKDSLDAIISGYYSNKTYLFEYVYAETLDLVRLWKDPQMQSLLTQYLHRKRSELDRIISEVDCNLADKIVSDWSGYTNYPRLNTKILRDILQPGVPRKETVWIIVFDGLRLDSWEKIVWPRLRELFVLEGDFNLYLSTLPSYTDISRVAFFAGALPHFWKDYSNNKTSNHKVLLPRLLGISRDDAPKKVQIVARSEEKVEQQELALSTCQYNVLIFNISDTWIHAEQGSLVQVNETIQRKLESLVIPELENCIGPNDTVVVTSDHGFIELRDQYRVLVDDKRQWNEFSSEYQSPVYYRYLRGIEHPSGKRIQYDSSLWWTLPVGFTWFDRPKGKPTRYSHGGISMGEMVVPGIRLKKITERNVILQLVIEPISECVEGEIAELRLVISNKGSISAAANISIWASGTLIQEGNLTIDAGKSTHWNASFDANEVNRAIDIVAKYKDEKGNTQSIRRGMEVPMREAAKIKIDTSALDVFDN